MKQETIKCDVMVIGAGPAGCLAASTVASQGLNVVLIDKKQRIGEKPHCGEFVPKRLVRQFDISSNLIDQSVDSMETIVLDTEIEPKKYYCESIFRKSTHATGSGRSDSMINPVTKNEIGFESILTQSEGFMIDRQGLDMSLAKKAAFNGAVVLSGSRLLKLSGQELIFKHRDREFKADFKVLIGADGSTSTVGQAISSWRPDFLLGIQCQVPLAKKLDRTVVFFHKAITHGYGWLFPKGLSANVGLGMTPRGKIPPTELLGFFLNLLKDMGVLKTGILSRSRGLIPVSGVRTELVRRNVVLAGDAAGLTHPITGAGAPQAMISGELAGLAAVKAIKQGKTDNLSDYEREIRGIYSGALNHAISKRKLMIDMWSDNNMKSICSQTWIAFEGYRKRVRKI